MISNKEKSQELSRLIRIEQEVNIENENKTHTELIDKIDKAKRDIQERQHKLKTELEAKNRERRQMANDRISIDLYKVLIHSDQRNAISVDNGVNQLLFYLEKAIISTARQANEIKKLNEKQRFLKTEISNIGDMTQRYKVKSKKEIDSVKAVPLTHYFLIFFILILLVGNVYVVYKR